MEETEKRLRFTCLHLNAALSLFRWVDDNPKIVTDLPRLLSPPATVCGFLQDVTVEPNSFK